jgi:hypothetical protein
MGSGPGISKKAPYSGPNTWVRFLVYLGLNGSAGIIWILASPGGSVQTFGTWIEQILVMPLYAPAFVAFVPGGLLHSPALFVLSLLASYIGSIVLTAIYFTTTAVEKWYLCCAIFIFQLVSALLGATVFVHNLQGWT